MQKENSLFMQTPEYIQLKYLNSSSQWMLLFLEFFFLFIVKDHFLTSEAGYVRASIDHLNETFIKCLSSYQDILTL